MIVNQTPVKDFYTSSLYHNYISGLVLVFFTFLKPSNNDWRPNGSRGKKHWHMIRNIPESY